MVLAVLAFSFVSLAYAEDSAADDTTMEPATISTATTIASGEVLELNDAKFTSNGKYVLEPRASLALPMVLKLTSDTTDGTIIEMKAGSIITVLSSQVLVLDSDMTVTLKGELSYDVNIDLSTMAVAASIDISDNGRFGLMGFEMTGGKDKELTVGLDSTGKGFDISLNVPSITYKGAIPGTMMSSESSMNGEITVADLKLSANISGDMSDFTIKGQKNSTSATISASKIVAKIYNEYSEMNATIDSPTIGVSANGNTSGRITLSVDYTIASGESNVTSPRGDFKMTVEKAGLKATVIVDNSSSNTVVTIGGAGSDYATITAGSIALEGKSSPVYRSKEFSGRISDIDLKIKMTADGSGPTDVSMKGGFDELSFNGYLPYGSFDRMINGFSVKDVSFDMSMDSASKSDMTADVKAASFEISVNSDFPEGFKAEGKGLAFTYKNNEIVLTADSISATIKCITDQMNYLSFEGNGISVNLTKQIIAIADASATVGYPTGTPGTIKMKNMKSVDNVISGEIEISSIRDDLYISLILGADADVSVTDSVFYELQIADGAKVNGTILLSKGDSKIVFADGSELTIDDETEGIVVAVSVKDSVFQSGKISLQNGYGMIPARSYGMDYTVDSDGKTATLSQGYGNIVVHAEAVKYTIRYNNAASQIALGESLEIESAPAESGYRFVGWFDGIVFSEGTYYSLTVPGDRTLTPVFEPFQKRYSSSGKTYILDIGTAERINLDNTELSRVLDEMSSKGLSKLEIRNDVGSITVPFSDLYGEVSVSFEIISFIPQDDAVSDKIGSSPAFEIRSSIQDCSPVCSIKYRLSDGQSANDIVVGSVNQYGRTGMTDSRAVDNGDGTATLTFTAPAAQSDELSGYYVTTYSQPAPAPSEDSDSGISMAMIAGIVVGVIIVAAIVAIFMKKRNGGSI